MPDKLFSEVEPMVNQSQREVILLKPLVSLAYEQQMEIRTIRNEVDIRNASTRNHEISIEEHMQWISRLERLGSNQIVFAILSSVRGVIGSISVDALDLINRKAEWSFFLSNVVRGGLGKVIEYHFLNFVFDVLKLEKLNGEVLEGNEYILALHNKFFFIKEGFKRSNILKNGVRIGVHFVGLTQSDWFVNRARIFEEYKDLFSKYEVQVLFDSYSVLEGVIDE
jgi:UDP-4-amino-4,6-dideoxy-N-acetyl-beta-L-altrosamine N-acetyltransferase